MICKLKGFALNKLGVMLAVIIGLASIQVSANVTRYILKNNQSTVEVPGAKVVDEFSIGKNHYTVVELENASSLFGLSLMSLSVTAEKVEVDWPIVIDNTSTDYENQNMRAWHVDHLQYAEIEHTPAGQSVIVAVLDTGIDYNHLALAPYIWQNPGEIAGNGIDDDMNGYIDDVVGWDFDSNNNDPMDTHSHGTHCAGIITSSKHEGSGAVGVAGEAQLMAVRIIGNQQAGFLSNGAKAIKYAVDNGAHILSNSWRVYRDWSSFDPNDENVGLLRDAIAYAAERDVLFVAATGNEAINIPVNNEKNPIYPVGFDGLNNIVGVASTTIADRLSSFSNYGKPYTHVAAPGTDIMSTVPGNKWAVKSGTSMATPIVAGALARGLSRGYSIRTAVSELIRSSHVLDSMKDKVVAEGRIDLVEYMR